MSIIGIGTDLIEIIRIKDIFLSNLKNNFINRILSENEIILYNKYVHDNQKINFIAKRFTAKEALSKAIGSGIGSIVSFNSIDIINNNYGEPIIKLKPITLQKINNFLIKQKKINSLTKSDLQFKISITDTKLYAQSFAIVENIF